MLGSQIGFEGQMRHSDDGIHGGADFMAHVRQKIAFGSGGFFGLVSGLIEILHHVEHGQAGIVQFMDAVLKGFICFFALCKGIF